MRSLMSSQTSTQKSDKDRAAEDAADMRRIAVAYIDEAFAHGRHDGLDIDNLAHGAIFAALRDLVTIYGEDATAIFAETLAGKIKSGAYTQSTRH
jgi:hypothetical protein